MNTLETIEKLGNLDLSTYPLNEIKNLINGFNCLKVVRLRLSPNTLITRIRRGRGYSRREELSYPPVTVCQKCQRASLPMQTMFYGTLSDSVSATVDNRAIALSECSSLTRQGIASKGIESFTVSNWSVVKPITVAAIVDDIVFENIKGNKLLELAKDKFKEFNTSDEYNSYARFVANEFSKPVVYDYDYLISAAISDAYVHQVNFDGIVYPSVRIGGQAGMDIALKPNVVDESLMLMRAAEMTFCKNGDKSMAFIDRVSDSLSWNYRTVNNYDKNMIAKHIGLESLSELPIIN